MENLLQIEQKENSSLSLQPETILKGIMSKISFSTNKCRFRQSSHQSFLRKQLEEKYEKEAQDAQKIFDKSLVNSYKEVKKKLFAYGRSVSYKMENVFEKANRTIQKQEVKEKKQSMIQSLAPQRTIFIDRKYNSELSTKTSILCELQSIQKIKEIKRKARSQHSSPLSVSLISKIQQCNSIKNICNKNPLLNRVKMNNLRKRKRKSGKFLIS